MIKMMPLKQVCTDIVDCPHESPEWLSEGIPIVRNFNLIDGQIDMSDAYYVDEPTYQKRTQRAVPSSGDIIFSREAPIGNCAIVPPNFKCCLGQRLVLLKVNSEICSPDYLLAALLSDFVKSQIAQVEKRGSIVSNFNIGDLKDLLIPIIDTQESVASISKKLYRKLALNKHLCKELEAMAKTLYDYWFTQFDFPDDERKPYRSSGGEMVWNEQLKREIPKGWGVGTVDTLLKIDNTSVDPKKLGNAVMEHYSIPALDEDHSPSYEPAYTIESGKYRVDKECILTSKLNPRFKRLWDPFCDTKNAICSTEFIVYRPRKLWMRPFCYAVLNSDAFYTHMSNKAIASTGSRKRIQPDVSAAFALAIPDDGTIRSFSALCDPIMKKLKSLYRENRELQRLRDWLLPMLMNGQARVE